MIDRTSAVLSEGASSNLSPALRSIGEALEMVFRRAETPGQMQRSHNASLYKVYVAEDTSAARPSDSRVNFAAVTASPATASKGRSVGYWCFSAGRAQQQPSSSATHCLRGHGLACASCPTDRQLA